jgi:hypothetical protein
MADITMCEDNQCPNWWRCHRAQAQASARQSYFAKSPREGNECSYFWDNRLTVGQFKKRVASFCARHPSARMGQTMFNMAEDLFGMKFQTEEFERSGALDPFYEDSRCEVFLAFLVRKELLLGESG